MKGIITFTHSLGGSKQSKLKPYNKVTIVTKGTIQTQQQFYKVFTLKKVLHRAKKCYIEQDLNRATFA